MLARHAGGVDARPIAQAAPTAPSHWRDRSAAERPREVVGVRPIIGTIGAARSARTVGRAPPRGVDGEGTVHVHHERLVSAPIEHVFELTRDIEWLPGWNPNMEMRSVNGPLDRVGTTFETTLRMLGLQFAGKGSVVAADARRLVYIRVDCTEYGGTSDWIYRFAPAGQATRCSIDIVCEESGTLVLLEHIFGRPALQTALERVAQQLLDNLAALAEPKVPQPAF